MCILNLVMHSMSAFMQLCKPITLFRCFLLEEKTGKNGSGLAYCINMLPEKCSQNCVNFASDQEAPLDPEAPLPAKCC